MELRRQAPDAVAPNVPFDIRFEYANVGDLLATDVGVFDRPYFNPDHVFVVGQAFGDLAVELDVGSLSAGEEGRVSYQAVASCSATELVATDYEIYSGDPSGFPVNEPSVTTVLPFSSAPMPATVVVDAPLDSAAEGDTRRLSVSFDNPADMIRPVSFRAAGEPCWQWNAIGGEGRTVIFTPMSLTWTAEVPANGRVTMTIDAERIACSEAGTINSGLPVTVTYGCGLMAPLDLSNATVGGVDGGVGGDAGIGGSDGGMGARDGGVRDVGVGDAGFGDVGVFGGDGGDGGNPDASPTPPDDGGCSLGARGAGQSTPWTFGLFWALMWRRRRASKRSRRSEGCQAAR